MPYHKTSQLSLTLPLEIRVDGIPPHLSLLLGRRRRHRWISCRRRLALGNACLLFEPGMAARAEERPNGLPAETLLYMAVLVTARQQHNLPAHWALEALRRLALVRRWF